MKVYRPMRYVFISVGLSINHACSFVAALFDVFAGILDGLDGAAQLHIDVGLLLTHL